MKPTLTIFPPYILGNTEKSSCPIPPYRKLQGKGSVVQLASFPGSGNTWVRHLLQRGSGVATGSKYHDTSLMSEFPAEGVIDEEIILSGYFV